MLPLLSLFTLLALFHPGETSLAQNVTFSGAAGNGTYVGYVDDPNGRGTATLVLSCLLTLVLCVWSALHLNVPQQGETVVQCILTNVRWIAVGVFAPEMVVFTAWRQWSSARILGNIIKTADAAESAEAEKRLQRRNLWTMTHSFFASTGGFAFEIEDEELLPTTSNRSTRLFLTARGMALLAKCGLAPDVPAADIEDKSKANDVAKALVIIQALWMVIQVIGRLAAKLTVTLLEVNTIAHVLCAFLMFSMWWYKPLTPKEPIIIRGAWVKQLHAYMYLCSEVSGDIDPKALKSGTIVKTVLASLRLYSKVPEIEALAFSSRYSVDTSPSTLSCENRREDPEIALALAFHLAAPTCVAEVRSKNMEKAGGTAFFERRPRVKRAHTTIESASNIAIARWRLATKAIENYPVLRSEHVFHEHEDGACLHFQAEEYVAHNTQNWPQDDLLRDVGGLVVGIILWLACLVYGSIHLAAWNEHFPTTAEQWLWRSSSAYIAFCGGLWIVLNYVVLSYGPLNAFWERWMDGGGKWWQNVIIGVPVITCGASLVFARAFIVIEAFISIRELPVDAYKTPSWTQVFPHF